MTPIRSYACKTCGFYALMNKNKNSALNILLRELFRTKFLYKISCQVHLLKGYDQNTVQGQMYHITK